MVKSTFFIPEDAGAISGRLGDRAVWICGATSNWYIIDRLGFKGRISGLPSPS
jgi:hypothetical protein